MIYNVKLFICLSILSVLGTANASSILYETRAITGDIDSDYKSSWNNQSSAITHTSLNDFTNVFGGNETFSHLAIGFSSSIDKIKFQFGLDGGYGGAVYFDDKLKSEKAEDLWWAYNWGNSEQILSSSVKNLMSGPHVFDIYWAEDCCNGGNSARFSLDGGASWQNATVNNLNALPSSLPAAVPVPAAIWLFGSVIAGFISIRRNKAIAL